MPNTKSAKKALRKSLRRRERNLKFKNWARKVIKRIKKAETPEEAAQLLPTLYKALDKMAVRNIIHKNKAARLKSRLTRLVQERMAAKS